MRSITNKGVDKISRHTLSVPGQLYAAGVYGGHLALAAVDDHAGVGVYELHHAAAAQHTLQGSGVLVAANLGPVTGDPHLQ